MRTLIGCTKQIVQTQMHWPLEGPWPVTGAVFGLTYDPSGANVAVAGSVEVAIAATASNFGPPTCSSTEKLIRVVVLTLLGK